MRPEVLILDEPTAGLDPAGCEQILENICDYREKTGATVLIVSHNMDDVARLSERIIVFDHGKIAMDGTPEKIFSQPERLISMGLTVPHSTAVAMELRRLGLELPETVYTHEKLLSAVIGAGEVGKC